MTILNQTLNFYRLYQHCMGTSEVPKIYHYWACVSMIAAVLEDRVYFEFYKDRPIFPNLYVMLLGPSGVSKGLAISEAVDLVDRSETVLINKYRGQVTAPRLVDRLGGKLSGGPGAHYINDAKLWLIMDELANDIGAGGPQMVRAFLRMMTELYTGHYVFDTGTRMHGDVVIDHACVSWLCGTTKTWLLEILTKDMVESGFTPRILPIFSDYVEERVRWPEYPADRELVYTHLKARLFALRCLKGRFELSPDGDAVYSKWYMTRTLPDDQIMRPFWQRQRVLMFKLAMLFSIMDGGPLVMTSNHIARAIQWVMQAQVWHEQLMQVAHSTPETSDMGVVLDMIKQAKEISRSDLLKKLYSRGINAKRLNKAMQDLLQREDVENTTNKKGGVVYVWKP